MIDLQRFRKEKKLTQGDISNSTGLDQAVISKYESGKAVTDHVTDILINTYPELKDYIKIEEKVDYLHELISQQKELISNLTALVNNNTKLVESNMIHVKVIERLSPKKYTVDDMPLSLAGEPDEGYGK